MGPRRRRCYPEVEGRWEMESRWGVRVQGPMGPGSPEGDSPVTASATRASEVGAWRADGRPIGECTRPRRPQYGKSYYTGERRQAAYGEPLRRFFADEAWVESVVDFGHAKKIFPDADVFPSIIVARKPTERPAPPTARVCAIPREQLRITDLKAQIQDDGF